MKNRHLHHKGLPRPGFSALLVLLGCVAANGNANEQEIRALVSGNTLLITNKYGPSNVYFDPSGVTLSRSLTDPLVDKGRWRATSDSVCSIAEPQPDGRQFPEYCMSLKGRKIGEEWTADDPKNGKLVFKLVRGDVLNPQ